MEQDKIKAFLQKINLSPKEVKVYLYCLGRGPQLISQLAKVTNTTRTNAYDIIKKLESKGLCHTIGSAYGRKVKANNPEDIKDLLENKEKETRDLKNELQALLPAFREVSEDLISPFTKVSYFEGADNVRKMIWQSLQSKNKELKIAGSELDMATSFGKEYLVDFHTRRKGKGIKLFALRPDSNRVEGKIFANDKEYLREIRIRPKGKVRLKSNLILWDNYVAFYSLKSNIIFGTLIESEDMAIMFGSWFDFIWEGSKKLGK
jgi:sugar-specific transcriptional regulator TrmB